jgi:hypothetical protein
MKENRMNNSNLFVFAIGRNDGTWREEIVESPTIMEAQSKIYNMYPRDKYPDIAFRLFLHSV